MTTGEAGPVPAATPEGGIPEGGQIADGSGGRLALSAFLRHRQAQLGLGLIAESLED